MRNSKQSAPTETDNRLSAAVHRLREDLRSFIALSLQA
jgi:hypothetical protein